MVERTNNPYQPKEPTPEPDDEVFERAKTDPDAFGLIFRYYVPVFCSYVRNRINIDFDSTTEMVDGVFVGFVKHLQRLRVEPGIPPAAYLWRSVNNAISNWKRNIDRHPTTPFDEEKAVVIVDFETPENLIVKQETKEEIHRAIEGLTPLQQRVINLIHFAEMTAGEVAQQLNTTEEAVRAALSRARQQLRKKLK